MRIKEILLTYQGKVQFPWSVEKIQKAGFEPAKFLSDIVNEINQSEDAGEEKNKEFVTKLQEAKEKYEKIKGVRKYGISKIY